MRNLIIGAVFSAFIQLAPFDHIPADRHNSATSIQKKVSVRPEDLPEAVGSALAGNGYAEWKVSSAYLITKDDSSQYYEINLRRGEETATLNLDKYGKKMD